MTSAPHSKIEGLAQYPSSCETDARADHTDTEGFSHDSQFRDEPVVDRAGCLIGAASSDGPRTNLKTKSRPNQNAPSATWTENMADTTPDRDAATGAPILMRTAVLANSRLARSRREPSSSRWEVG